MENTTRQVTFNKTVSFCEPSVYALQQRRIQELVDKNADLVAKNQALISEFMQLTAYFSRLDIARYQAKPNPPQQNPFPLTPQNELPPQQVISVQNTLLVTPENDYFHDFFQTLFPQEDHSEDLLPMTPQDNSLGDFFQEPFVDLQDQQKLPTKTQEDDQPKALKISKLGRLPANKRYLTDVYQSEEKITRDSNHNLIEPQL